MTVVQLPVSATQAVVGGILGIGIVQHQVNLGGLTKIMACWVGTPTGAALISALSYFALSALFRLFRLNFLTYDKVMRIMLLVAGAYGAYALGANNVAIVTGVFYKAAIVSPLQALLIGGLSIGLGAMTYSKNVMLTIGRKIVPMDAFTAFVAVFAAALTVNIYAWVGVPVPYSQAIVGAVVGIGLLKKMHTVSTKTLTKIAVGWAVTPVMSAVLSVSLMLLSRNWS
jgi:PiT family inorganic phosphate transporter